MKDKWTTVTDQYNVPVCIPDCEYIREMKITHGGAPEIEKHNRRLEKIAKKLEEKQDEQ